MPPEDELLAKLEEWLAAREEPPTVFDVIETGDGELLAAFILEAFRAAAREAVIERLAGATVALAGEVSEARNPVMRVYDGLARAWSLDNGEKAALLGLADSVELEQLRAVPQNEVPTGIVERLAILLDIFKAINILLPVPKRADAWLRAPNRAPMFSGKSALDVMIGRGLEGLRQVRDYLQAQLWVG